MEQHFLKSSYREKLIEHLFISELLKKSWRSGNCALEFSKPEVDRQGYDLIAEENGIIRHIQLKTSHSMAKASKQKVHTALASKPSGCVVWIFFNENTLELGPFLFFGGPAGEPLADLDGFKTARHTKGNAEGLKAERPAIRDVPKSRFARYQTIDELYKKMFVTDPSLSPDR